MTAIPKPVADLRAALFENAASSAIDSDEDLASFVEAVGSLATDDFYCVMDGDALTTRYEGVEGLRDGWADFMGAFETIEIQPGEVIQAGDAVLELVQLRGRPKGSQGEVVQDAAAVWRLRGDQVEGVEFHLDQARARASAGVPA